MVREVQRFNQFWLWLLQLILLGNVGYSYYTTEEISFIALSIIILLIVFFYLSRLEYTISEKFIQYKFFPLMWKYKKIPFDQIDKIKAVNYHPLRDYGGWGIRSGMKGTAFTTRGNKGILINLKTGKTILIGTQQNLDQMNQKLCKLKNSSL